MREAAAKDRISNLPEPLVHHILSFLGIKDVARTSVLSKRWNSIRTTVPTLDFRGLSSYSSRALLKSDNFMDIVDRTLRRHNSSNVDKFFLSWYSDLTKSRVHSWISTLLRGNLREINLYLPALVIPPSLFSCETLTTLVLGVLPDFTFPKLISLPRLKRLKFVDSKFSGDCWNEELFSNCPVLEKLILESCTFSRTKFVCISIPSLKFLKFTIWNLQRNFLPDFVLKIYAPRLVSFSYTGCPVKEYILSSFPALGEADVSFKSQQNIDVGEVRRLLGALAHCKCLIVSDITLQAICSAYDLSNNLLTFHNVKRLKISDNLTTDQGLIALLKAVPNLESLVFQFFIVDEGRNDEATSNYDIEDDSWAFDDVTNGCLFPHLKTVCFQQLIGNRRELRWVRLILRNAKALQMMTISYYNVWLRSSNDKSEKEIMVEIPSFPRASAACKIKFCS